MPFGLHLNREIKVGDLLTSISVWVAILALLFSWQKESSLREAQRAQQVRLAAAKALAKLERWRELSDSLYDDVQGDVIATTDIMRANYDVIAARDHLYSKIGERRAAVLRALREEDVPAAYVDVVSYVPSVRDEYKAAVATMYARQHDGYARLLKETQDVVLEYRHKPKQDFDPAVLGNELRAAIGRVRTESGQVIESASKQVYEKLHSLLMLSDDDLLKKRAVP
jgi:hypothetical protein